MLSASLIRRLLICMTGVTVLSSMTVPLSTSFEKGQDLIKKGTLEIGIMTGVWQATTAIGDAPSANRSAVFVLPRVGVVVTNPLGMNWWRGDFELIVEPVYARFTQPFAADLSGASLLAKYNFLSFGRWMPFWDIGAGMVWTNLAPRIPEQSTQMEFLLQTGPGVQYFASETVTLTAGIRFSHISNANLGDRNTGINSVMPYVGLSFFLPR
jgi:lipid A 3-O-deacylase